VKKQKDEKNPQPDENVNVMQETESSEPQQPAGSEDALRQSAKIAAAQMMEALKRCEELSVALEGAQLSAKSFEEQYLRLRADFDNYRKRTVVETAAAQDKGMQEAFRLLFPTIDNLERALDAAREEGSQGVIAGIEMVIANLKDAFAKKGLVEIEALGLPFNPRLHEAIMQEPCEDETKKDTVAQVLQKGYVYKDQVLRYATVKVLV
jgi:molecular chaperone GrpE